MRAEIRDFGYAEKFEKYEIVLIQSEKVKRKLKWSSQRDLMTLIMNIGGIDSKDQL